jgi:predicted nucleotidyltransferase
MSHSSIRKTEQNKKIREIARLLQAHYSPSKLFLFGSRAEGTNHADSDYDFVMVLPRFSRDRLKVWEECRALIKKECGVNADVFSYSEAEFQKHIKEFSSIPETALNTGREIALGASSDSVQENAFHSLKPANKPPAIEIKSIAAGPKVFLDIASARAQIPQPRR